MQIRNKIIFITGANRGIGKALVEAALTHGVKRIYAAARNVNDLPDFADSRVVPITLDITNRAQVKKAAENAMDVEVLINNAGSLSQASIINGPLEMLMYDMEVNYFGTLNVTRAFAPIIARNGGGAIASISSVVALGARASVGGYSASKAALLSAIQASRAELKSQNISVHGIFPGPIDTEMARAVTLAKTSAEATAEKIIQGIEHGVEDIYPDPRSAQLGEIWAKNPKEVERIFATL